MSDEINREEASDTEASSSNSNNLATQSEAYKEFTLRNYNVGSTLVSSRINNVYRSDKTPIADINTIKGGLHTVAFKDDLYNLDNEEKFLSTYRLRLGMEVYVIDEDIKYRLVGGIMTCNKEECGCTLIQGKCNEEARGCLGMRITNPVWEQVFQFKYLENTLDHKVIALYNVEESDPDAIVVTKEYIKRKILGHTHNGIDSAKLSFFDLKDNDLIDAFKLNGHKSNYFAVRDHKHTEYSLIGHEHPDLFEAWRKWCFETFVTKNTGDGYTLEDDIVTAEDGIKVYPGKSGDASRSDHYHDYYGKEAGEKLYADYLAHINNKLIHGEVKDYKWSEKEESYNTAQFDEDYNKTKTIKYAKFNGINSYMKVLPSDSLKVDTRSFSVSLWQKFEKGGTTKYEWPIILSKDREEGYYNTGTATIDTRNFAVHWRNNSNTVVTFTQISGGNEYAWSKILNNEEVWQHIVLTGEIDNNTSIITFRLYLNGELKSTIKRTVNLTYYAKSFVQSGSDENNYPLFIGTDRQGGYEHYFGCLSNVRIYNRPLSQLEVKSLLKFDYLRQYKENQQSEFLTNGLVAHYPFSGDCLDHSGNNNNPDLINNIEWIEEEQENTIKDDEIIDKRYFEDDVLNGTLDILARADHYHRKLDYIDKIILGEDADNLFTVYVEEDGQFEKFYSLKALYTMLNQFSNATLKLAGSGVAGTAARSDHHHDDKYASLEYVDTTFALKSHNHGNEYAIRGHNHDDRYFGLNKGNDLETQYLNHLNNGHDERYSLKTHTHPYYPNQSGVELDLKEQDLEKKLEEHISNIDVHSNSEKDIVNLVKRITTLEGKTHYELSGSGKADTAARSDHDHDDKYYEKSEGTLLRTEFDNHIRNHPTENVTVSGDIDLTKILKLIVPEIGRLKFIARSNLKPIDTDNPSNDFDGWCYPDGRLLDIEKFSEAFRVYGYTFGGSGNKFKIPDLRQVLKLNPNEYSENSLREFKVSVNGKTAITDGTVLKKVTVGGDSTQTLTSSGTYTYTVENDCILVVRTNPDINGKDGNTCIETALKYDDSWITISRSIEIFSGSDSLFGSVIPCKAGMQLKFSVKKGTKIYNPSSMDEYKDLNNFKPKTSSKENDGPVNDNKIVIVEYKLIDDESTKANNIPVLIYVGGTNIYNNIINDNIVKDENTDNPLVAYYPFYDDFLDHSGNENNPEVNTGARLSTIDGYKCALFGTNKYIRIPSSPSIRTVTRNGVTVCGWQYLNNFYGNWNNCVLTKANDGDNIPYNQSDIICQISFYRTNLTAFVVDNYYAARNIELPAIRKWVFVAQTIEKVDDKFVANIYVYNGEELKCVATINCDDAPENSQPLLIGKHPQGSNEWHNGYLREIRVYNKALSLDDLKLVMEADISKKQTVANTGQLTATHNTFAHNIPVSTNIYWKIYGYPLIGRPLR